MSNRPYVETLVFVGGISAEVRSWVQEHPDFDTEVAWGSEGRLSPGGRAASAAVAAMRLGRKFVDLVGSVGDDLLGQGILGSLAEQGLSTRLVEQLSGSATGITQVVVDSKGERRTVGVSNANWQTGDNNIRKAESTIFGSDLVYVTLEVPLVTVRRAVGTAAARGVPVILDATPMPSPSGDETLGAALLSHVDVLLTNWTGAQHLAEMPGATGPVAIELGKRLLRLGPRAVVITMGEHGALVAVRGRHAMVQPAQVRVMDTASAGDAFAGALAVGLTAQSRGEWRWEQLLYGVRYATAAASACVAKTGSQDSLPTKEEVDRYLASVT